MKERCDTSTSCSNCEAEPIEYIVMSADKKLRGRLETKSIASNFSKPLFQTIVKGIFKLSLVYFQSLWAIVLGCFLLKIILF